MEGTFGAKGGPPELWSAVNQALAAEDSVLRAASRLLELGNDAVRGVSVEVHLPTGFDRDAVFRCIAVRAQETLTSVLQLVEMDASHHARLLLRPLVEDHIRLGWLRTLDVQVANRFIALRVVLDVAEGYEAQRRFLPTAYSALGVDPVPSGATGLQHPPMAQMVARAKDELRELGRPFGWQRGGPTVKAMAEAAGRVAEYDFFYLATSRSVHSNLHEMGRMVWGDPASMTMTISSDKLDVLHRDFSLTYGVWLYSEVLGELGTVLPQLRQLVDSEPWSVWLAFVLAGMARNGRLPPIVSDKELRWGKKR